MTDKEKKTLIDYFMKQGYTKKGAESLFKNDKQKSDVCANSNPLTKEQRNAIIFLLMRKGFTQTWIANCLDMQKTAVHQIVQRERKKKVKWRIKKK